MTKTNTPKVREYQEDGSFVDRDMTAAELAQAEIDAENAANEEAAKAAKEAAKQEALSKLGLTAEESAALLS